MSTVVKVRVFGDCPLVTLVKANIYENTRNRGPEFGLGGHGRYFFQPNAGTPTGRVKVLHFHARHAQNKGGGPPPAAPCTSGNLETFLRINQ